MKYLVTFDIETTGVDISKDRIVQIAILKRDLSFGSTESFKSLVNPQIDIPKEASDVHGITNDDVKNSPTFSELAQKLLIYFEESFISGFNHENFDIPLLIEEFMRLNIDPKCFHYKKIIDVSNLYRHFNPRTLSACYKQYTGNDIINAHDAMADVIATEDILTSMITSDLKEHIEPNINELDRGIISFEYLKKLSKFIEDNNLVNSKRVDFDKKFIRNELGLPLFNFGKNKGKSVYSDLNYLEWMLKSGDFTSNTKKWCKQFLDAKK